MEFEGWITSSGASGASGVSGASLLSTLRAVGPQHAHLLSPWAHLSLVFLRIVPASCRHMGSVE